MKTPWHLWLVGIVALAWGAMGCMDYVLMQTQRPGYLAAISENQKNFIQGMQFWAHAVWAISVWATLLGAIFLLVRSRFAGSSFAIGFAAMIVLTIRNLFFADPSAVDMMGNKAWGVASAMVTVGLFFVLYARSMGSKGVLR